MRSIIGCDWEFGAWMYTFFIFSFFPFYLYVSYFFFCSAGCEKVLWIFTIQMNGTYEQFPLCLLTGE